MATKGTIQSAHPTTTITNHPRPLVVVHQAVGLLSTACRRIAGGRRFDVELGTFVQDSSHLTIYPDGHPAGTVVCDRCLLEVGAA